MIKRIAITPGEPAGIGPDLVVLIAQQDWPVELIILGNKKLLQERARLLNLELHLVDFSASKHQASVAKTLTIVDIPLCETVVPQQLNIQNASYVINTLEKAAHLCLTGVCSALVTGPVHKAIINAANIPFIGHTEFFAKIANTPSVVMLFTSEKLKLALATTHVSLKHVTSQITPTHLENTLRILHRELKQKFNILKPRILVCGLNPHAGENGYLGMEEIEIITPVMEKLRQEKFQLIGPIPADTAFTQKYQQHVDVTLAMYHDQGLPVLKALSFGDAVNITLGLPFVRTSVDHGTALDLAGTGTADPSSLQAAITTAIRMIEPHENKAHH